MGKLVLVNDVQTGLGESGLIVGSNDAAVNDAGVEQSEKLAKFMCGKIGRISLVVTSDASRSHKILHRIRIHAKDLSQQKIRQSRDMRERDFGVLTGSNFYLDTELFRHTRICAEGGESISQCQDRVLTHIKSICHNHQLHRIVVLTHPFVCQILTNVFLKQSATMLSDFWFKKASFAQFGFEPQKYGLRWNFDRAYNAIDEKKYPEEALRFCMQDNERTNKTDCSS